MIIQQIDQLSEAWFHARLGRVTGTSFKDLLSSKTTAGYNNLIADLASEIISESTEEIEQYANEWMQRGTELEPVARQAYAELMGVTVLQVGFVVPDEDAPFHDWIGVSPDGLIIEFPYEGSDIHVCTGMLEIKCPKRSTHMFYITNNKLPSEYYWQVQGQLFVTGLPYCDFFSYYPKMKPFLIRVYPDPKAFANIKTELELMIPKVNALIKAYKAYDPIDLPE